MMKAVISALTFDPAGRVALDLLPESDSGELRRRVSRVATLDGGVAISDLNELLHIRLPDDDWDTLAGLVFSTLEHVPVEGEELVYDGWQITATEMEGRRIRKVRLRRVAEPTVESSEESASA